MICCVSPLEPHIIDPNSYQNTKSVPLISKHKIYDGHLVDLPPWYELSWRGMTG